MGVIHMFSSRYRAYLIVAVGVDSTVERVTERQSDQHVRLGALDAHCQKEKNVSIFLLLLNNTHSFLSFFMFKVPEISFEKEIAASNVSKSASFNDNITYMKHGIFFIRRKDLTPF